MGQIKNIKLHIVTDIKIAILCSPTTQINNMAEETVNTTEETVNTTEETVNTAEETVEPVRDDILDTEEMKKLYVRGIDKAATDEEFKEFFETQSGGMVESVAIIRKEGETRNHFGFVTFGDSELIDTLLLKRAEITFKGKTLEMNRAVPKTHTSPGAHDKTKKLFIANVPKIGVSEDDLMKYFKARHPEKFGTIEKVELIKKKDAEGNRLEENKGFGFVTVSSEDMADKMAIQHASFEFGGRKIELKKSSPPGEGGRGGGRGGRGGRGGGRGGGQFAGGYGSYGGYGDYYGGYGAGGYGADYGYGGYGGGYGGYGGYGQQAPRGKGRGQRYTPY